MNKFISCIFIFVFVIASNHSFAQGKKTDSLWIVFNNKTKSDTERLQAVHAIAMNYLLQSADTTISVAEKELFFARNKNQEKWQASALNILGAAYMYKGEYPQSLNYYLQALKIREKIGNKNKIASSYINIGVIYYYQKEYSKALDYYFKALKIYEDIGNKNDIGAVYNDIGDLYEAQKNYTDALTYFLKDLKISEENDDKGGMAESYNNIGIIYSDRGESDSAMSYYFKELLIAKELEDKQGIGLTYYNIGTIYYDKTNFKQAILYCDSGLQVSREVGDIDNMRKCYESLSKSYAKTNRYKDAYDAHVNFKKLTDSIFSVENSKQLSDQKTKFEVEKKEAELKVKDEAEKDKIKAVDAVVKQRQSVIIYAVAGVLLIVIIFSIFLLNRFTVIRKQKNIIELQKHEVENQKELVEEKQKEIIDSITYAKRLQEAILPPLTFISEHLPDSFVLYKPKDIVAGDFYWMEELDNTIFIAAADCTGHGVPGAMVSVVCSNALNRAVKEFGLRETGKILDKVTDLVLETFEKSSSSVNDGMDISLLSYHKIKKQIQWSGANNPLWYISGTDFIEVKADKQPIGKHDNRKPFTSHTIPYAEHSLFYLFTDGLPDQFGGLKGKKFMYKKFAEKITENSRLSMSEQKNKLEKEFEEWKGTLEQVDDVTAIGIKI